MPELSIQLALVVDIATLLLCSFLATLVTKSLLHPAPMALASHFYIVTIRLFQLFMGFRPMAYRFTWPVATSEVVRAGLASDLALLGIALGWFIIRNCDRKGLIRKRKPLELSRKRVQAAVILALVLGAAGMAYIGRANVRRVGMLDSWADSGYVRATTSFAAWGMCLLHYLYGFAPGLTIATVIVFLVVLLFNAYRAVVILPAIFLLLLWISRRQQRNVPWFLLPAALAIWLLWLPLKPIIYTVQDGGPISEAIAAGVDKAFHNFGTDEGSGIDFQFLDMVGSTMTLVDLHGAWFWGGTIAPLLVSPVPRLMWPDKPQLTQYQLDLDIPSRNMAKLEMTPGLVGEAYANFGWIGVFVVPLLVSICYSVAYVKSPQYGVRTPANLLYLLYLAVYLQVYRDGLISTVWFPFVHCAPVGLVALSHWIFPFHRRVAHRQRSARVGALVSTII
jgi:hypothetical protein